MRTKISDVTIDFFDHYFEWTKGGNRIHELESKNRIELSRGTEPGYIEPDGVFVLRTPIGRKLYLFEMHR